MMESTRTSMLNHIEDQMRRLPPGDPRRAKLKFIRYGFLYGAGFPALSRAIKATKDRECDRDDTKPQGSYLQPL